MEIQKVKWYQSLGFKGIIGLACLSLWLFAGIILVMNTKGKALVLAESSRVSEQIGNYLVSELNARCLEIAALCRTLAETAGALPQDTGQIKNTLPRLIDFQGDTAVAGGGYWPEPYAFSAAIERHSFFWGRDSLNQLQFYDDYNLPGPGYHHEEWYVVVRHLPNGQCSWSRSYMDPYSYQPMVTGTVAVRDDQARFIGTATIDLKLEGLQAFVENWLSATGGYIFILDRNNKFITFPDPAIVKNINIDSKGRRTEEFMFVDELAAKIPAFTPLAQALNDMNRDILEKASQTPGYNPELIQKIDDDSYQINHDDAQLLAAISADPLSRRIQHGYLYRQLQIDNDVRLNEAAIAYIFHVPFPYWKVVIVKPYSQAVAVATTIIRLQVLYIGLTVTLLIGGAYFVLNRYLLAPLAGTTQAVQVMGQLVTEEKFDQLERNIITHLRSDEIGLLASVFNILSMRFAEVHRRLQQSSEELQDKNIALADAKGGLEVAVSDLNVAMRTSQIIASELVTSELIKKILQIVVEMSGALRGVLILDRDGTLYVAAEYKNNIDITLLNQPLNDVLDLPLSVINHAAQNHIDVVLQDAQNDPQFSNDPYLKNACVRSVLCVPLIHKNKSTGLLYLENKDTPGVFAASRLEVLKLVTSRTAVALENALLHEAALENERMMRELAVARQIQEALLPRFAPSVPGLALEGRMIAAKEVGGDYYDFIQTPGKKKLYFAIADVTGKGVAASLLVVELRSLFHVLAARELPPREILVQANHQLFEDIQGMDMLRTITVILGYWDTIDNKFVVSGAGHEPLIIRRANGTLETVYLGGIWLGIEPDIADFLTEQTVSLDPGDTALLFTDGVTECHNASQELFGIDRLTEFMAAQGGQPPQQILDGLFATLDAFRENTNPHDDITTVVIHRT